MMNSTPQSFESIKFSPGKSNFPSSLPITEAHRKRYGDVSPRMFQADWMEYFSHVHPIIPLLIWAPVAMYLLVQTATGGVLTLSQTLAWALAGFVVWTLTEYVLHRWVFHFKPFGTISKRIAFMIHGVHHEAPNDATRLVMPPVAAFVLALILWPLFRLAFGTVTEPVFGGFLIGYLTYDYTHFAIHHFRPRTAWGRSLKDHHMKHHFVTPELRWGVSNTVWDHVFRTMPK